jgi:hypothetical protein
LGGSPVELLVSASGSYTYYPQATTTRQITFWATSTFTGTIDNVSVKELSGNHASQPTAASRPVLRARHNLLTYSEQFDATAWTKGNCTITSTTELDPLGGTTADRVQMTARFSSLSAQGAAVPAGVPHTFSAWVKCPSGTVLFYFSTGAGNTSPEFTATTEWQRFSWTHSPPASAYFQIQYRETAPLPVELVVWGAQLVSGSEAKTYQRIAAATDYATGADFPVYLDFDGTDDWLATAAVDFSATDAMSVFAGVRKENPTLGTGVILEQGVNGSELGTIHLFGQTGSNEYGGVGSKGTAGAYYATVDDAALASPSTNVLSGTAKISTDTVITRVDGVQRATNSLDQGAGNYAGNLSLYIGARGGTSVQFDGRIHSLIVRGAASTAGEISDTEAYVATKTGVALP